VLVAIGSADPTATAQVARLAASPGVADVPLRLDLLAGEREEDAVQTAVSAAAHDLPASHCVVVHATAQLGAPCGSGVGRSIPRALAAVAGRLAQDGGVDALVLSGGETAVHVARALHARGLVIEDELEPGVPVSRLIGPRPYAVVTKAGAFGDATTLVKAVEALCGRAAQAAA
jgi:uncharacterized protein YgbK (DUF1537 family)